MRSRRVSSLTSAVEVWFVSFMSDIVEVGVNVTEGVCAIVGCDGV